MPDSGVIWVINLILGLVAFLGNVTITRMQKDIERLVTWQTGQITNMSLYAPREEVRELITAVAGRTQADIQRLEHEIEKVKSQDHQILEQMSRMVHKEDLREFRGEMNTSLERIFDRIEDMAKEMRTTSECDNLRQGNGKSQ